MKDEEAATPKKQWKQIAAYLASIVFFIAMLLLIIAFLVSATRGEILFFIFFLVASSVLGILSSRFHIVDRYVSKFFGAYLYFCIWMMITLGPLLLFYWLSYIILDRLTLKFQISVFVVWGLLLILALWLIATERNRERLLKRLQKIGFFAPVAYSVNLLMIATIFFSSVTYVLFDHGVVKLSGATGSKISPGNLSDFYLWHFMKAIPLLEVNNTLRWNEPLTYDDGVIGLVLLLFKLIVIVPVIAAFAWYWKQVGGQPEKDVNHFIRVRSPYRRRGLRTRSRRTPR